MRQGEATRIPAKTRTAFVIAALFSTSRTRRRLRVDNPATPLREGAGMPRTKAPFSADQVGSLLRTPGLKEARARRERGEIGAADLRAVEDVEIARLIEKQEEVGLRAVTDGEFRRSWWHFDFLKGLDGVEGYTTGQGIQFQGVQTRAEGIRVTGTVGFTGHPMLEHFRFLKDHARAVPKMTIPSPS